MILYSHAGAVRADYYDSEGHVIRYAVRSPAAGEASAAKWQSTKTVRQP